MKKLISLLLALIMVFSFAMCSLSAYADDDDDADVYEDEYEYEDEDDDDDDLDISDSENTGKWNDEGKVYCYKSPIKETTGDGGELNFIARAENETETTWFIFKDSQTLTLEEATEKFEGLQVLYWEGKEGVTIKHVPIELDGWKIRAKFDGDGGPVYSNSAVITVNEYVVDQYWFDYWHNEKDASKRTIQHTPIYWWYIYDSY